MDEGKIMWLAALLLLLGGAGAALPAAARPQSPRDGAAAQAPSEAAPRAKAAKPLVMLVCQERRADRRGSAARISDLACTTRWAAL